MSATYTKALGGLLSLTLIALSLSQYLTWRSTRSRLETILVDAGLSQQDPDVLRDVLGEEDPLRAKLAAARGLLANEVDPAVFRDLEPAARRQRALEGLRHLEQSRSLAGEVLERRPASWEAHLIVGASSFLEALRTGQARPSDEPAGWEGPLVRAHQLAPGQKEPLRFLGAAYLSDWSRLNDEQRARATEVLENSFEDPATLELLLTQWLRAAPTLEIAYSILPETSAAWQSVMRHSAARLDWERYCEARDRYEEILLRELVDVEDDAIARLRLGDVAGARQILIAALDRAPVRGPFDQALESILRNLPPGSVPERSARTLERWLDWNRERCLQGSCSLPRTLMTRLTGLAELRQSSRIAEVAVMAGDLSRAEEYERRSLHRYSDEWAPFLLLKAQLLIDRGHHEEARQALAGVSAEWRRKEEYRMIASVLESVPRRTADDSSADLVQEWPASAWVVSGAERRLRIPARRPDHALEVDLQSERPDGAPVEILWNGGIVSHVPVIGSTQIRIEPPAWLELNILSVVPLEGRRVRLGSVRLTPRDRRARQQPLPRESSESPSLRAD